MIEARDYAPDLARLIQRQDRVRDAILTLADRPGVALTAQTLAEQIAAAGTSARRADHDLLRQAADRQAHAAGQIEEIVGRARTRAQQKEALIWATLAGMAAAMAIILLGNILATRLERGAPEPTPTPAATTAGATQSGRHPPGRRPTSGQFG